MRFRIVSLALFYLFTATARAESPQWIWAASRSETPVRLSIRFEVNSPIASARLQMATVSARAMVHVNQQAIAALEPYDPLFDQTIAVAFQPGTNELAIEAESVPGPPGVFAILTLTLQDGRQQTIATDRAWNASTRHVVELGPVESKMLIAPESAVQIGATDNYEQWKQALGEGQTRGDVPTLGDIQGPDPASFLLSPGFEIRLVRSAQPEEDSWVSMEFDPHGRLIVAKEKAGLLRMTLSADGGRVTNVESFADTLQECRGLAFLHGHLYANANNSKALFRIPLDGDTFEDPESLFATSGGVGHGRNDLAVGSDGMLYSIHGDAVDLPLGDEIADLTSPFRESRRGQKTREGHLLRIDPQSGSVEVLAAGLRNPFGIDFNRDGEVFTYDADAEFDMGAPWYRPTRVSHLVVGGDYGWRGVTGNWPPYYPDHPDNARPNLDIGKGSPTAVKFGTTSQFPGRFGEALYILDWAYGRIIAVHMIPRGSSYLMVAETFLKGRPLNVTDLGFAPDGSMYLVTGGRQTQSALYRVRWVGEQVSEPQLNSFAQSRRDFASDSRRLRRTLESALVTLSGPEAVSLTWKHLGNADPWISHAARNLLERQPVGLWSDQALLESHSRRASQSLLALSRSGQSDLFPKIIRRLNQLLPSISDRQDKWAALYAYSICLRDRESVDDPLRIETAEVLNGMFPSSSPAGPVQSHNWLLAELLVGLEHPDAVAKSVRLLNHAGGQRDQMHYLHVLRRATVGWTLRDRRDYFSALAQGKQYLVGAGMDGFLKQIREEAEATLTADEQELLAGWMGDEPDRAVVESGGGPRAVPATERALVRRWTPTDSIPQLGDAARGAKIFDEANCVDCHRYQSRGTLVGPDLTSVARRFNRRDLLVSILEPSKVIAENYRALQIVTTDGRSFTGLATMSGDYRSPELRLAIDPTQPMKTIRINKTDIESQKPSTVSWMPEGLLDHFNGQEIADLMAYLLQFSG